MSLAPQQAVGVGVLKEQEGNVAVGGVHQHSLAVHPVEQRGVLPVAHIAFGEAEIEGRQQAPQLLHRQRAVGVLSGDEVLGLQPVVVGQEFQGLHLFRADGPAAVQYVVNGLVARLVDQLAANEAGIVLELASPDAPGQGFQELQLLAGGAQFQNLVGLRRPVIGGQGVMDETGVALRGAVPLAGVEPGPVAVVVRGDAVYADVQQRDFLPRHLRRVDGGGGVQLDGAAAVGEGHTGEHIHQPPGVVAGVHQVLQCVERIGGTLGYPRLPQQPVDGRAL